MSVDLTNSGFHARRLPGRVSRTHRRPAEASPHPPAPAGRVWTDDCRRTRRPTGRRRAGVRRRRPPDRAELTTHLYHTHLPKLDAFGVVDYEPESGTVRYVPDERLDTFVDSLPKELQQPVPWPRRSTAPNRSPWSPTVGSRIPALPRYQCSLPTSPGVSAPYQLVRAWLVRPDDDRAVRPHRHDVTGVGERD